MKKYYLGGVAVGATILVAVGYYFIAPLFIQVYRDDAVPDVPVPAVSIQPEIADAGDKAVNPDITPETVAPGVLEKKSVAKSPQIGNPAVAVVATPGHKASGTARLLTTVDGLVIRYENFKTINGPDLYVYLASDLEATQYVDLGRLKATEGNINYAVPPGTDTKKYPYVLVWCKQFGVLFNSAKIN